MRDEQVIKNRNGLPQVINPAALANLKHKRLVGAAKR